MNFELKHCSPCDPATAPLDDVTIKKYLQTLASEWKIDNDQKIISKKFHFKNFYQTMAFVNAAAWVVNLENHHPNLEISYNFCIVSFTTHAINNLSKNDFICAAKIDIVFQPYHEKFYERK